MSNKNLVNIEKLKEVVGISLFFELVEIFGGKNLYIPTNAEFYNKHERKKRIREDFFHHRMDINELTVKYNLSKSRIYKIIETK